MGKLLAFLCSGSLLLSVPMVAYAAGTYYTGNYQPPQVPYTQQSYAQQTYAQGHNRIQPSNNPRYSVGYPGSQNIWSAGTSQKAGRSAKKGFSATAGLSYQDAMWQFEMDKSGSILRYDNISWLALDLGGGYAFNIGNVPAQIGLGFQYGFQILDGTTTDDDVTNGGSFITEWMDEAGNFMGNEFQHALSVGTNNNGNMLGFNVGFGLTDIFQIGNVKITPSAGFRYLQYKLKTEKNRGISFDNAQCFLTADGEMQCDPSMVIFYNDDTQHIIWRDSPDYPMIIPAGTGPGDIIIANNTYYFEQSGTSHSYDVSWMGPYIALDMDYAINQHNMINGRIEFGMPWYDSEGDQPYRYDWKHPKSVEDKAGFGNAYHFGLGLNWETAITDTVSFTLGMTYDYYTVSNADTKTYLNPTFYNQVYENLLVEFTHTPIYDDPSNPTQIIGWDGPNGKTEEQMLDPNTANPFAEEAQDIKQIEADCSGWVCSLNKEVKSFYKSLGFRVGIDAKF